MRLAYQLLILLVISGDNLYWVKKQKPGLWTEPQKLDEVKN
jgi:hypothetical protein